MLPTANITANLTTLLANMVTKPPTSVAPTARTLEELEAGEAATPTASPAHSEAAEMTVEAKPQDAEGPVKDSSSVFGDLRSSADELKKQIDDAEHDHFKQIKDHEEYLKEMLQEKRANNSKLEQQTEEYRTEIALLHQSIDELFQRAKTLKLEGKVWRDNWRELEQNLTLVMDATQERLKSQGEALSDPSVTIINELNTKTEQEQAEDYRNELLMKVSGSPVSLAMLKGPVALSPEEKTPFMVRMLNSQLAEMAEATTLELQKLDDSYNKSFQEEADRERAIRHDQIQFEERKAGLMELREKLTAAVQKFEALKQSNEKKGNLIRAFISSIAANPAPTHGLNESWDDLMQEKQLQSSRLEKRLAALRYEAEEEHAANESVEANSTLEDAAADETPSNKTRDVAARAARARKAKAKSTKEDAVADAAAEKKDTPLELNATAEDEANSTLDDAEANESLANMTELPNMTEFSAVEAEDAPLEVTDTEPEANSTLEDAVAENVTLEAEANGPEFADPPLEATVLSSQELSRLADFADYGIPGNVTRLQRDDALAAAEDAPLKEGRGNTEMEQEMSTSLADFDDHTDFPNAKRTRRGDAPAAAEDAPAAAADAPLEVNAAPLPATGTQLEFAAGAASASMPLDAVAAAVVALEANATKELAAAVVAANVTPEEATGVLDGTMAMNLQEDSFREEAAVNTSRSEATFKVQKV